MVPALSIFRDRHTADQVRTDDLSNTHLVASWTGRQAYPSLEGRLSPEVPWYTLGASTSRRKCTYLEGGMEKAARIVPVGVAAKKSLKPSSARGSSARARQASQEPSPKIIPPEVARPESLLSSAADRFPSSTPVSAEFPETLGEDFPQDARILLSGIAQLIEWILSHLPPPTPPPQPCDCSSCPPDPTMTCSYIGEDQYVEDAYLANAYRGNLFLTPGDARGVIGGLLHSLTPPQHYSHMGIVVADTDHSLIRHCTSSEERLTAKEYYSGSLLGVSAPADGLTPDHVQYGWPGTITQSVYQAFFADRYGTGLTPPGYSAPYTGSMLPDAESTQSPKSAYLMNQLGFDPVSDDGETWFPPLIVKPCPSLQQPVHSAALNRIAQHALSTYAHYRFFAYSNGSIGGNSDFTGPDFTVPDAQPAFDLSTGRWVDWTSAINWVTKPTIAGVCSSFAWQMVQDSVPPGRGPKIILDWAKSHDLALGEDQGKCVRAVAPVWQADVVDEYTRDGLYFYSEDERKTAGKSLHDNLSQRIYDSLKQSLHDAGGVQRAVAAVLDDIGRAGFILAAEGGVAALSSVVTPLLTSTVIDSVFLAQLIELLYDMPEDIANQMCNSFTFDCTRGFPADTHCVDAQGNEITDIDSDNWSSAPGPGRAVSPDDIHMFWDALGPSNDAMIDGLYGYNVPAKLCVGVFNRAKCVIVPSTGIATISGVVRYKGRMLAGAYVSAACECTLTAGRHPFYKLSVRSGGQYKVIARYEDPQTGEVLYGEAVTGSPSDPPIQPNTTVSLDIQVTGPPACMRNVLIQGVIRCDDVYLTGSDNDQTAFQKTLFVQAGVPVFDTTTGAWNIDTSAGHQRLTDNAITGFSVGDSSASIQMSVRIDPANLSVDVTVDEILNPEDDNMSTGVTFNVPKDQTVSLTDGELDTGGPFNDRAYFRGITVANNAVSAI